MDVFHLFGSSDPHLHLSPPPQDLPRSIAVILGFDEPRRSDTTDCGSAVSPGGARQGDAVSNGHLRESSCEQSCGVAFIS